MCFVWCVWVGWCYCLCVGVSVLCVCVFACVCLLVWLCVCVFGVFVCVCDLSRGQFLLLFELLSRVQLKIRAHLSGRVS